MVEHLSTIRLAAIRQSGHWRVEMKWPKRPSRYFGKFHSQSEAEEWIEATAGCQRSVKSPMTRRSSRLRMTPAWLQHRAIPIVEPIFMHNSVGLTELRNCSLRRPRPRQSNLT